MHYKKGENKGSNISYANLTAAMNEINAQLCLAEETGKMAMAEGINIALVILHNCFFGEEKPDPVLDVSIERWEELSTREKNLLKRAGLRTGRDMLYIDVCDIIGIPGCGEASAKNIINSLPAHEIGPDSNFAPPIYRTGQKVLSRSAHESIVYSRANYHIHNREKKSIKAGELLTIQSSTKSGNGVYGRQNKTLLPTYACKDVKGNVWELSPGEIMPVPKSREKYEEDQET